MKKNKKYRIAALLLVAVLLLSGCGKSDAGQTDGTSGTTETTGTSGNTATQEKETQGSTSSGNSASVVVNTPTDLGDETESFGEDIQDNLYAGFFEETTPTPAPTESAEATATPAPTESANTTANITITCLSGTAGCYTLTGNTLTFTNVSEDSVYTISGQFKGNIVIDIGDDYKFDLEMHGFSIISDSTSPITVLSGDRVTLTAKKEYQNYIYDTRAAVDDADETAKSGAVYSEVDLRIAGKGELTIVSENNNGIHTKDDLEVKNLTLTVQCVDNALKGNDSVTLENATAVLIATAGDGIKTSNSDISSKGNQRGTITVTGGTYNVYAACDGLDAAYNVVVEDSEDSTAVLNIFTDKYSNYSEEVTAVSENVYYIRFTSKDWKYSVKYYNSDDDYVWVNPEYHSSVSGGRTTYYYYSFPKMEEYGKMQYFIYSSDMELGQEEEYLAATDYLTINSGYDTFALEVRGNSLSYSWTNYTTTTSDGFGGRGGMGGFGGMNEGNPDKGDYSTKGIKASNEIIINAGAINIKSYDDAIHANNDTALENGETPKGNVTVNGGTVTVYSNDDGLHADGTVTIADGMVTVTNSYEGVEGNTVEISGGKVSIKADDDGINGTTTTGTAITIGGGELYIYCSGDGIDSNSRTSYSGIVFNGGNTVVISTSSGNSAIDTEQGYQYNGGSVVAIMPSGGMSSEAVHCKNFSSIGSKRTSTMIAGRYVTVTVDKEAVATIKMPSGLSGMVIYLGSNGASVSVSEETSATLDANGVCWYNK